MAEQPFNYEQTRYEQYSKERGELFKTNVELGGRYDQWILTLSAGAIGLSIAFLEKIAPHPEPNTIFILGFSWFWLLLALLSGFIALLTAQYSATKQIEFLDADYAAFRNAVKKGEETNLVREHKRNRFSEVTNILNWISASTFVLGVLFLCVFAYSNMAGTSSVSGLPPKIDVNLRIQNASQLPLIKSGTNGP
ncbi:MAG: hypothetical protein ACREIC_12650 [Limisphaerales bacterium]